MFKEERYTIGEVSEIVELKEHVLRYWEKEFEELAPEKTRAGQRRYSQIDIDVIERIKTLLYEDEFTISGAQKQLKEEVQYNKLPQQKHRATPIPSSSSIKVHKQQRDNSEIVSELREILKLLQ